MEKKTTIRVPEAYVPLLEDIRLLTADQNNPNRTTLKQQEQIEEPTKVWLGISDNNQQRRHLR